MQTSAQPPVGDALATQHPGSAAEIASTAARDGVGSAAPVFAPAATPGAGTDSGLSAAAESGAGTGVSGCVWERWTRPEWFGAVTDPACRWSPGRDRFDALRLIAETVLADPAGVLMRHHTTPTTL
ncbi:MAG: hypothetical protein ACK5MT_19720, partial [Actinomycetales bacterium]